MSVRSTLYFDHKVWAFQTNQVVVALLVGGTYRVDVFKLFYYYYSLAGALLQIPSLPSRKLSLDLLHWSLGSGGSMRNSRSNGATSYSKLLSLGFLLGGSLVGTGGYVINKPSD
ncbi:uncharacterized protein BO95DRAFT_448609 [Aspergillus brunneoviolaceus CBS 621.78]|uniref:Uncharacterized protein n=1 Tax=Aspergillus brunneoviolaceus CBS 621.78 TaxID=1450534 RepID=A0ACD1FRG9_9EURO|nr:hypothetical protein BO95DRAFT_448609 [Aspergillus brunneoviolaceus CBS 621.78]RAH39569.1 hypothetical protein BO95DRAFT_448609 [Aspergillus brunneoviolaceus CBS 621.78]